MLLRSVEGIFSFVDVPLMTILPIKSLFWAVLEALHTFAHFSQKQFGGRNAILGSSDRATPTLVGLFYDFYSHLHPFARNRQVHTFHVFDKKIRGGMQFWAHEIE